MNGNVNALLSDGHGGWFASGSFRCVGKVRAPNLVHLESDGALDRRWRAALPIGRQYATGHPVPVALARVGRVLFAGGTFGVEALDASTGQRDWLTPVNGLQGVFGLAANGRAVYAAGDFTRIDGRWRSSLGALDPNTGHLLRWQPPAFHGTSKISTVDALALGGPTLYVGGNSITSVDGHKRPGFAALNARNGRLTTWVPETERGYMPGAGVGDVETILVAGGEVLSAGLDGWGVTNARTGRIETWMYDMRGVGRFFAGFGSTVYLGGNVRNGFSGVAGMARNNLAAINVVAGRFTQWAPRINRYVSVSAMAASRDTVLVGGSFSETL